ncbi:MAG TPA: NAD(P)-dependent oxidoreductase, partial [Mycolicibacillus parakoreensis]|nr:NAD(P)-dependent oxidoreductase [Mycolicibacillus parakoreensis]
RAYDVEGMDFGVIAAGRIGRAVLERMKPFGVHLHYTDIHRLPGEVERDLGLTFHPDVASLAAAVDIVSVHSPLYAGTRGMFDETLLTSMRRGAYLVNTARAEETVPDAVVAALESGQLAGYAGDVWHPQPPAPDHPWRRMPHHAMTPHVSGSTLSAQARYAAGTREILEDWLAGRPICPEYLIVADGALAGTGAHSYR